MRRLLTRSALMLGAVVLGLGLAEIGVRVLDLGPRFQVVHRELFQLSDDPELGYELRPLAPDGAARINSAGFRDREFERSKPASVFRIVAVGDSVTFGQPHEPEASWPKELERLLNLRSRGTRFEVLNLGVTGYNVLQVAERLRTLGLAYEPDLVLYGYVLNDPQELSIELEALRDLRDAAASRFQDEIARSALRRLASSRLFLLLRSRLQPEPSAEGKARPDFRHRKDPAYQAFQAGDTRGQYFRALHEDPAGKERLRTGLARIAEAARHAGVPVVVALFPLLLDARGPYPLSDVHAEVAREAEAQALETIDLAPALERAATSLPGLAVDFLHPSANGCRVFALALITQLERLGRLPPASLGPWSSADPDLARCLEVLGYGR